MTIARLAVTAATAMALSAGLGGCVVSSKAYKRLDESNKVLTTDLEASKLRAAELEKKVEALESAASAAEKEKADRISNLGRAQAELDDARRSVDALEGRVAELQEEQEAIRRQAQAKEAEIVSLAEAKTQLETALQGEIDNGQIKISRLKGRILVEIAETLFFASGRAEVLPGGRKALLSFCQIMKKVPDKAIKVEGHTDSVPIKGKLTEIYPTNWELGSARAVNVVRFMQDSGGIEPDRLSAISYGQQRPVASNDTEEGRARNRRIEILIADRELDTIQRGKDAPAE